MGSAIRMHDFESSKYRLHLGSMFRFGWEQIIAPTLRDCLLLGIEDKNGVERVVGRVADVIARAQIAGSGNSRAPEHYSLCHIQTFTYAGLLYHCAEGPRC